MVDRVQNYAGRVGISFWIIGLVVSLGRVWPRYFESCFGLKEVHECGLNQWSRRVCFLGWVRKIFEVAKILG